MLSLSTEVLYVSSRLAARRGTLCHVTICTEPNIPNLTLSLNVSGVHMKVSTYEATTVTDTQAGFLTSTLPG